MRRSRYDIKINIKVTFNKAQFTDNEFEKKQSEDFLSTEISSGIQGEKKGSHQYLEVKFLSTPLKSIPDYLGLQNLDKIQNCSYLCVNLKYV